MSYDQLAANTTLLAQFKADVILAVASAIAVDASNVSILRLMSGSVVVDVQVVSPSDSAASARVKSGVALVTSSADSVFGPVFMQQYSVSSISISRSKQLQFSQFAFFPQLFHPAVVQCPGNMLSASYSDAGSASSAVTSNTYLQVFTIMSMVTTTASSGAPMCTSYSHGSATAAGALVNRMDVGSQTSLPSSQGSSAFLSEGTFIRMSDAGESEFRAEQLAIWLMGVWIFCVVNPQHFPMRVKLPGYTTLCLE